MKKKSIKIILLFFILTLITYLSTTIYKKIQDRKIAEKNIATLPGFSFLTLQNKTFLSSKIHNYDKIIINYFNPECEHCQYMAQAFLQNSEKLKVIQIIMVTFADSSSTANFKKDYHLDKLSNLLMLRDTKFQFQNIFGSSVIPSFFVYKNKKLVKKFIGETKIENLLN